MHSCIIKISYDIIMVGLSLCPAQYGEALVKEISRQPITRSMPNLIFYCANPSNTTSTQLLYLQNTRSRFDSQTDDFEASIPNFSNIKLNDEVELLRGDNAGYQPASADSRDYSDVFERSQSRGNRSFQVIAVPYLQAL